MAQGYKAGENSLPYGSLPRGRQKGLVVGETAHPHHSPESVVPLDRGAPLLLLPTAAQLRPLQLLLQLGDLAARDGGEKSVRQRQSILVPSPR